MYHNYVAFLYKRKVMLQQRWQSLFAIAVLFLPLTLSLETQKFDKNSAIASSHITTDVTPLRILNVIEELPNAKNVLYDTNNYKIEKIIAQKPTNLQRQRRTALVIGNAGYKEVGRLKNPINDASDIANSLQQLGFEVTLLQDVKLQQMEEAIEKLNRQLRQGGIGLFYFSGHGVQVDGENYLVPIDARMNREQDVRYEALPMGKLLGVIEDAGNDANIIILDACRNNPFSRSWRAINRGLAAPTQTVKGVLIAYATAPGTTALDGEGRNSPYSSALLKYIKTPALDVEQMFKQVRADVVQTTKGEQIPWESSSLIGSFAFNFKADSHKISTSVTNPLPVSTPSTTPSQPASLSTKTAYFTQAPRLVAARATYKEIRTPSVKYYFTIDLPENAGEPLQKITINQREGIEYIRFQLKKSFAFEGKDSKKGQKLGLQDISSDEKNHTVSIIFNPPVPPGKIITIALETVQNPTVQGVYLFGVTASPAGEKFHSQFLGFGRLHFYPPR